MVRSSSNIVNLARRAAVVLYLQQHGPSTTTQLARALGLKPATMNQWLFRNQQHYFEWVRMPNYRWLLLEEEPVVRETCVL